MTKEEIIREKLLCRGFTKERILNNRGLIGAVIEELEALNKPVDVEERELIIKFKQWEIDNDIKNLLPEQLADFYLEDLNS